MLDAKLLKTSILHVNNNSFTGPLNIGLSRNGLLTAPEDCPEKTEVLRVICSVYWPTLRLTSVETSYVLHKTNFMYAQKTAADGNQATAGVKEEIDS